MKKNKTPSTNTVLDFLDQVEKQAKRGKIPKALSKEASFEKIMKFSLSKLFVRFAVKNKIKATDFADMISLPKTCMSDILNYKTDNYTVDRLLSYARKLAEIDPQIREHLHLMLEVLGSPVRSVKETKKIEKEILNTPREGKMKKLAMLIFLTISICAHAYDPHHLGKDMDLKDPFQVLHYFQNIKPEKRTADDKKLIAYAVGLLNQVENKSLGLSSGGGNAQCGQVLIDGVYNSYMLTSNENKYELLRDYVCKEASGSSSNSGGLSAMFEGLMAKGKYSSAKQWYENECKGASKDYSSESRNHLFIKEASGEIIKAWSDCVQKENNGLSCWAIEEDDLVFVYLKFAHGRGNLKVKNFITHNLEPLTEIDLPTIEPGEETFMFTKKNASKGAAIVLNGYNDNIKTTCSHVVAAPKKELPVIGFPFPDHARKPRTWCAKLYNHHYYKGEELFVEVGGEL